MLPVSIIASCIVLYVSSKVFGAVTKATVPGDLVCPEFFTCSYGKDRSVYILQAYIKNFQGEIVPVDTEIGPENIPPSVKNLHLECPASNGLLVNRAQWRPSFKSLANVTAFKVSNCHFSINTKSLAPAFSGLPNLRSFEAIHCNIPHFTEHLFRGLQFLKTIKLAYIDSMKSLDVNSLTTLKSLETLDFHKIASSERIILEDFIYMFAAHQIVPGYLGIRNLLLDDVQYGSVTEYLEITKLLNTTKPTAVRRLDLSNNHIGMIRGTLFLFMFPLLEHLRIANNVLIGTRNVPPFWISLTTHNHVKTIDMSIVDPMRLAEKGRIELTNDCGRDDHALPLSVGHSYSSANMRGVILISTYNTFIYPICIRDIHPSNNQIRYVDISYAAATKDVSLSFSLRGLRYFSLQYTNVHVFHRRLLQNMPELQTLLLGGIDLGAQFNLYPDVIFKENGANLTSLDLSDCNFNSTIHPNLLKGLSHLEYLNISKNAITLNGVNIRHMRQLRLLNVSGTAVERLPRRFTSALDHLQGAWLGEGAGIGEGAESILVDLTNNTRLMCTPELETWISTTRVSFVNPEHTFCRQRDDDQSLVSFSSILNRPLAKRDNVTWKVALLAASAIVAVIVSVAVIFWKVYRWQIALLIHQTKQHFKPYDVPDDKRIYEHDVYICYNKTDREWVTTTLLLNLESNGLKTLLHERDYLPGAIIENAIQESITSARFTLLVITQAFLQSKWCLRELVLSRDLPDRQQALIPILLSQDVTLQQLAQHKLITRSFLQWPESCNAPQIQLFWNKLITRLSVNPGRSIVPAQSTVGNRERPLPLHQLNTGDGQQISAQNHQ